MTLHAELEGQIGDFRLHTSLRVDSGVTAIFGPSGAGKTLILRALAGLWLPQKGRVSLDGSVLFDAANKINVPCHKRRMGVVLQTPLLFPHMTVEKNIAYGQRSGNFEGGELIELLEIQHLLPRMPAGLSGGEAQRVALARALYSEPQVLLLDEPLTGLDDDRRAKLLPYFKELKHRLTIPIIYVSHRRDEVSYLADSIYQIEAGRSSEEIGVDEFSSSGAMEKLMGDPL